MAYPPQIERLRSVLKRMPGVTEVEADHTALQDIEVAHLSLVAFGDLPHAAIRRTDGGRPAEALGQVFITLSPTVESWRTLEFISWQVRDWSRAGRCIQRKFQPILSPKSSSRLYFTRVSSTSDFSLNVGM